MSKHITDATRLTVLKHLAKGKSPDVVAAATKLDRYQVVDIGSHHGYPHIDKLARAVEILGRKLDQAQLATIPPGSTTSPPPAARPRPTPPRPRPAEQQPNPAAPPAVPAHPTAETAEQPAASEPVQPEVGGSPTVLTRPDELRVVINAGKQSSSKRTQNLTTRILNDVDRLQSLLREEAAKAAAAREAAERKAELQRKRDRLESELAEVRAELSGRSSAAGGRTRRHAPATSSPAPSPKPGRGAAGGEEGPSAQEIRSWAREAGVECPTHGRVPARVREAYQDAHSKGEAA